MAGEFLRIKPVGDQAILIELGDQIEEETNRRVAALGRRIAGCGRIDILEVVPAFASLLVYYDPLQTGYREMARVLEGMTGDISIAEAGQGKIVEIPVCYGGGYGEDLAFVAKHTGLPEAEVVELHSSSIYRIYMLGFLPGFPYLGGLDKRLAVPRLSNPRIRIPAGSVGIGGAQTGIYPIESPGGWQLIGRTPLRLYQPELGGKIPYDAGDSIRFIPIPEHEFMEISRKQETGKIADGITYNFARISDNSTG
ncbi:MAG: 5-oxoprolinase subunit PxpB [Lachnospiraceae bacterium]